MALSERDQAILEFERASFKISGPKEAAIRAELELSSTRYYQLLAELIDDPEAYVYDPLLIRRLRQRREERLHRRFVSHEVGPRRR